MDAIRLIAVLVVVIGFVIQSKGNPQLGRIVILVGALGTVSILVVRTILNVQARRRAAKEEAE